MSPPLPLFHAPLSASSPLPPIPAVTFPPLLSLPAQGPATEDPAVEEKSSSRSSKPSVNWRISAETSSRSLIVQRGCRVGPLGHFLHNSLPLVLSSLHLSAARPSVSRLVYPSVRPSIPSLLIHLPAVPWLTTVRREDRGLGAASRHLAVSAPPPVSAGSSIPMKKPTRQPVAARQFKRVHVLQSTQKSKKSPYLEEATDPDTPTPTPHH